MMKMKWGYEADEHENGITKMDANSIMYPEVPEEDRKATMQHLKDMMNPPKKVKPKKKIIQVMIYAAETFRFQSR